MGDESKHHDHSRKNSSRLKKLISIRENRGCKGSGLIVLVTLTDKNVQYIVSEILQLDF